MPEPVICISAAFVDELFHAKAEKMIGTTNETSVTKTAGGVGRNILSRRVSSRSKMRKQYNRISGGTRRNNSATSPS